MSPLTFCLERGVLDGADTYLLLNWSPCTRLFPFIVLGTPRVPASCQPFSLPAFNPMALSPWYLQHGHCGQKEEGAGAIVSGPGKYSRGQSSMR